jgi:isopentenyl phosphate kinase
MPLVHAKYLYFIQFAPGSSSEVLITSADSRIRVVNGDELVHKFKGNASFTVLVYPLDVDGCRTPRRNLADLK